MIIATSGAVGPLGGTGGGSGVGPGGGIVQAVVMVAGIVIVGVFIVASIRGKIARRRAAVLPPRERLETIRKEAAARADSHAIEAHLLDTAQRLAAQLDAKAERLEQLLAEADERLASYEARLDAAGHQSNGHADAERGPAIPADPLATAVYRLADEGRDPIAIARELDEQTGKVELILALRADERGQVPLSRLLAEGGERDRRNQQGCAKPDEQHGQARIASVGDDAPEKEARRDQDARARKAP